jgi:hypothetical protein
MRSTRRTRDRRGDARGLPRREGVAIDDYTVRAEFARPTFFWADPFVGVAA